MSRILNRAQIDVLKSRGREGWIHALHMVEIGKAVREIEAVLESHEALRSESERLKHPAGNKCNPEELIKHGLWDTKVCALCFKIIQQENERLRAALEFYAEAGPMELTADIELEKDFLGFTVSKHGKRARQALRPTQKSEESGG